MRNGIKETVMEVTYKNGNRVAVLEQVISRADDCSKIGELYFRMSDLYRRAEEEIPDEERAVIEKELADAKAQIALYMGYLDGYGE